MSLKLCCALPVTLNCLKSVRLIGFLEREKSLTSSVRTRWLSTNTISDKQKSPFKPVYSGPLTAHVRSVKLFSLSSSLIGFIMQPILYKEIVSTGNVPVIVAAYSFIGFFTLVTPLLLHFITKKYITELSYNEDTGTYIAKTFNILCQTKKTEFKVEDIYVPDVPGMFVTFHVKGKPLFADPRFFNQPEHYSKLMGFDKPIDFKLYDKTTEQSSNSNK